MELYSVWLWYKIDGEEGYVRQNSDEFDDVHIKMKLNGKCGNKQEDSWILALTQALMPGLVSSSNKWPLSHSSLWSFGSNAFLQNPLRFFRKYMHV